MVKSRAEKRATFCRTPEDIQDVQREVEIMHHLAGHAHITRLKGSYEDKGNVHLVMELCSGGELFDRIVQRGHYTYASTSGVRDTEGGFLLQAEIVYE